MEVLPNGDLVLEGIREVDINGDRQIIVLSGIVRTADVGPGNVRAVHGRRPDADPLLRARPHQGQPEPRLAGTHPEQGLLIMQTRLLALAVAALVAVPALSSCRRRAADGTRLKDVATLQGPGAAAGAWATASWSA